jgi:hypothetical protein
MGAAESEKLHNQWHTVSSHILEKLNLIFSSAISDRSSQVKGKNYSAKY